MAGYSPETMVTIKVVMKAAIIAIHGITKSKPMADAIPKPIKIPNKIPTNHLIDQLLKFR